MREKLERAVALLQQIIAELDALTPVFPDSAAQKVRDGTCLNCGKPLAGDSMRGCHEACYHRINTSIRMGEINEREAIERGLLAPKAKPGRKKITNDKLSQLLDSATVEQFKQEPGKKKPRKG